jgi:hypothetical protein
MRIECVDLVVQTMDWTDTSGVRSSVTGAHGDPIASLCCLTKDFPEIFVCVNNAKILVR